MKTTINFSSIDLKPTTSLEKTYLLDFFMESSKTFGSQNLELICEGVKEKVTPEMFSSTYKGANSGLSIMCIKKLRLLSKKL